MTPSPGRRDTCGSLFPTPLLRRSASGSTVPVGLSGPRLPAVHSLTSDGASAALCSVRSAVASAVNPPSIIPARVGARLSGWKANSGVVKSHLISGFSVQPPSPYHFGGVCPPPFPATPPACSRSTEQVLYGIRHEARTVPDIRGAQSRWREAISSLRATHSSLTPSSPTRWPLCLRSCSKCYFQEWTVSPCVLSAVVAHTAGHAMQTSRSVRVMFSGHV